MSLGGEARGQWGISFSLGPHHPFQPLLFHSRVKFHTPLMCNAVPWAVSVAGGCQRILAAACTRPGWPRIKGRSGARAW